MKLVKVCEGCGQPFEAHTKMAKVVKYCSLECAKRAAHQKATQNSIVIGWQGVEPHNKREETCRWCGEKFEPFSFDGETHRGKFFCKCKCACSFLDEVKKRIKEGRQTPDRAVYSVLRDRAEMYCGNTERYERELKRGGG